jgi:hypothetical protein
MRSFETQCIPPEALGWRGFLFYVNAAAACCTLESLPPLAPAADVRDAAFTFGAALRFSGEVLAQELAIRASWVRAPRRVSVARAACRLHVEHSPPYHLRHRITVAGETGVVHVNSVVGNVVACDEDKVVPSVDVGYDDVALLQLLRNAADAESRCIAKRAAPAACP